MSTTTMQQPAATTAAANDPETFMMMKPALVEAMTEHFDSSPTNALCLGFGHFVNREGEKLNIAVMPSGTSPPYKQRVGVQYIDMSPFQWVYSTQLNRWLVDVGNCPHIFYDASFRTIVLHEVYIPTADVAPYVCGFITGFEKAVPILNMKAAFDHIKEKEALELAKVKSEWQDLNDTESEEDDQKPDKSVPPTPQQRNSADSAPAGAAAGIAEPALAPAAPAGPATPDYSSDAERRRSDAAAQAANDESGGRKAANDAMEAWEREASLKMLADAAVQPAPQPAITLGTDQYTISTVGHDANGRNYRELHINTAQCNAGTIVIYTQGSAFVLQNCAYFKSNSNKKRVEIMRVEPKEVVENGKSRLEYTFNLEDLDNKDVATIYYVATNSQIELRAVSNLRRMMDPVGASLPNWKIFIDFLHVALEEDKKMLTGSLVKRDAELAEEEESVAKHSKRKADEMSKVEQVKKANTAAEQPPQPPKLTKTVALDHNGRMYREYHTQAFNTITITTPAGFYLLLDCAMFVGKDGFKKVMHVEPEQMIKDGKKYLKYEFNISHMHRCQETVYYTVTSAKIELCAIQNVRSEMNPNHELPNWTSFIDYLHECLEEDKKMLTDSLAKRGAELAEEEAKHRKRKADEMADQMAKDEQVKKDEQMAKELAEADAKAPPPSRSKSGRPSKPPMRLQATGEGKVDATFKPGMCSPFNFNLTQEFVQERVDEIQESAMQDAFSVANEVYEHSIRTQMIYQFGINTFDDLIFKYGVEFGAMDRMDVEVAVVKARTDAIELAAFNEYVEGMIDWGDDAHIEWLAQIYPTHPRLLMELANTEHDLACGMYH